MTNSIDIQCRKWNITINNPLAKGLDHDKLKEILSHSKPIQYYCMSDEIGGETNTHHTHIYIHCTSPMRFSTLKNMVRLPKTEIISLNRENGKKTKSMRQILLTHTKNPANCQLNVPVPEMIL